MIDPTEPDMMRDSSEDDEFETDDESFVDEASFTTSLRADSTIG